MKADADRLRWEYAALKKHVTGYDDDARMLSWLNKHGAEGWELVHLSSIGGSAGRITWTGIFKRITWTKPRRRL